VTEPESTLPQPGPPAAPTTPPLESPPSGIQILRDGAPGARAGIRAASVGPPGISPGMGRMNTIGRYEIESLIGKGAMGGVFLARDPPLGRRVALKPYELPDGIPEEKADEFRARLLREAHAAANLSHPHIVTVHDAGIDEARGFPYIVMEYVPGRSLKEI